MFEKQHLNEIVEAVKQGIVASKESDSKFWGDFHEWRKRKDARDEEMHDTLLKLLEAKVVANGRLAKCETRLEPLEHVKLFSMGAIKVGGLLIGTIIALIVYIFIGVNNNLNTLTEEFRSHTEQRQ